MWLLLKGPTGLWDSPGQWSNTVFKSPRVSSDFNQGGSKLRGGGVGLGINWKNALYILYTLPSVMNFVLFSFPFYFRTLATWQGLVFSNTPPDLRKWPTVCVRAITVGRQGGCRLKKLIFMKCVPLLNWKPLGWKKFIFSFMGTS